jgi:hypothetical protein
MNRGMILWKENQRLNISGCNPLKQFICFSWVLSYLEIHGIFGTVCSSNIQKREFRDSGRVGAVENCTGKNEKKKNNKQKHKKDYLK